MCRRYGICSIFISIDLPIYKLHSIQLGSWEPCIKYVRSNVLIQSPCLSDRYTLVYPYAAHYLSNAHSETPLILHILFHVKVKYKSLKISLKHTDVCPFVLNVVFRTYL